MEATICQVDAIKNAEVISDAQGQADSINTLTSTEMSFVGGGLLAAMFA